MPSTIFGTCSPPPVVRTRVRHIHNPAALHSHGLNQRNAKKKPWAQWRAGAGRTIQVAAGAGAAAASCARNSQLRSGYMTYPRGISKTFPPSPHISTPPSSPALLCPCSLAPGAPLISHHRQRHHHRETRSTKKDDSLGVSRNLPPRFTPAL